MSAIFIYIYVVYARVNITWFVFHRSSHSINNILVEIAFDKIYVIVGIVAIEKINQNVWDMHDKQSSVYV